MRWEGWETRQAIEGTLYVESLPPPIVLNVIASASTFASTLSIPAAVSSTFGFVISEPSFPGLKSMLPRCMQMPNIVYTMSRCSSVNPSLSSASCIASNSSLSFHVSTVSIVPFWLLIL